MPGFAAYRPDMIVPAPCCLAQEPSSPSVAFAPELPIGASHPPGSQYPAGRPELRGENGLNRWPRASVIRQGSELNNRRRWLREEVHDLELFVAEHFSGEAQGTERASSCRGAGRVQEHA